jgi:SEC-C motif-containing protein
MRSRYSAFATKNVEYLWKTLHPDHEDRARRREEVLADLRAACGAHKYTGLTILDRREPDGEGIARVLFFAKVFRKGQDRSFVELSLFEREGGGGEGPWRYLAGQGVEQPERGRLLGLRIGDVEGTGPR